MGGQGASPIDHAGPPSAARRELAWWRRQLAGAPAVLELPTDRPRGTRSQRRTARVAVELSPPLCAALKTLSDAPGLSPFVLLLAAFKLLLLRYSGERDLVVGWPIAIREVGNQTLVGPVANLLALRTHLAGGPDEVDPPFRQLLGRVAASTREAWEHRRLPFAILVEALQLPRESSHHPLFQVAFSWREGAAAVPEFAGLEVSRPEIDGGTASFDLILEVEAGERGFFAGRSGTQTPARSDFLAVVRTRSIEPGLRLTAEIDTDLFDRSSGRRLLEHYRNLLAEVVAAPERRLSEYTLLSAGERQQLLWGWNDTAAAYARDQCLHELYAAQAGRTPEAVALVFGDQWLSYRELDRRANRLAHSLRRLGAGPDVPVGLCLERTAEMPLAMLAVLKAGGVCVPLDPAYPQDRLRFMIAETAAPVVLTQERLQATLAELTAEHRTRLVCVDAEGPRIAAGPAAAVPVGLDNLFYVIYTSGSTGKPKGVSLSHRALLNLVQWHVAHLVRGARTLQYASLSFDASYHEMFASWVTGGTVYVVPESLRRDVAALARYLRERAIGKMILPVVVLHRLAEEYLATGVPSSLEELTATGEQLQVTPPIAELFARLGDRPLHNHYGPSESHVVTAYTLRGEPARWPYHPSIGRPIANSRVYVLDRRMEPVAMRIPGELYLGGECLARGYLRRPELTAERFVPDPFAEPQRRSSDTRLYRTGDLARWLPDGNLEFLGRIDDQVKVRGFRVELGEIEAVLIAHPRVRESAVVVRAGRSGAPGDQRLVAYLVADGAAPDPDALRAHLEAALPDYMVPAAFVELEALPLGPTGKVNRRALPEPPESAAGPADAARVAPRDAIEELVAGLWSELLGRRVGAHDDFFALGGHSLLATQVASRLRHQLQVEVPLRVLFEKRTLAAVAACVRERMRSGAEPAAPPIRPRAGGEDPPLSFAQERLWFLDRYQPDSPLYNVPAVYELAGPVHPGALAGSLRAVVRRHEILRTTFTDAPRQRIAAEVPVRLPLVDLEALPAVARRAAATALAERAALRPFCLTTGPLLRSALLRLDAERHWLLLTIHHIVTDGWSMDLLAGELAAFYQALTAAGTPRSAVSPLPPLWIQYADFGCWQRQWLRGAVLEEQLEWWRAQLAGVPTALELPCDRPRPALQSHRGARVARILPAALGEPLRRCGQQQGTTLFMTLLAAWLTLLHRLTGQRRLVVGTPVANRRQREIEGLIGFFVNTLILRGDFAGDASFRELLGAVRETALGAYTHQDLPFERLVEELESERDLSRSPLFQVMFLVPSPFEQELAPGVPMREVPIDTRTSKFDLSVEMVDAGAALEAVVTYNGDLFDGVTIKRWLAYFERLLAAIVAEPEQRISEIPLLASVEEQALLREWNDTATGEPAEPCVDARVARQAARRPHAAAVVCGRRVLSYGELDRRAEGLARRLRRLGVGPEVLVAIYLERSPEMLVGMLGILKAGGAYLPIDPIYPPGRVAFMLADAAAAIGRLPVLLTQESLRSRLGEDTRGVAGNHLPPNSPSHTRFPGPPPRPLTPRSPLPDRPAPPPGRGDAPSLPRREKLYISLASSPSPGRGEGLSGRGGQGVRVREGVRENVGGRGVSGRVSSDPAPEIIVLDSGGESGRAGEPLGTPVSKPHHLAYVIYTSGSTGRPKGVMLAHAGLSNLVRWYQRTLGITAADRTTQVAGLSFDASVREIWSALSAGACLHLPDDETRTSPPKLISWLAERAITLSYQPAALVELLLDEPWPEAPALRALQTGGDRLRKRPGTGFPAALDNLYGPTENTVVTTAGRLRRRAPQLPSIGRPIANTEVAVIDRRLRPMPIGVAGELVTRGLGLARGYAGRPALTAERFIPDPHSAAGGRLYRTGDLVRWLPDGRIDFLGRLDHQVKIRGYRIELGEIEAVLGEHPAVAAAVVMPHRQPSGNLLLAAWVRPAAGKAPVGAELRRFLAPRLPEYMVPASWSLLAELPRLPSGKVDRAALPAPELDARLPDSWVVPRGPVEEILAGIWAQVLGRGQVSVDANFFELGGHSLLATQVTSRSAHALGVEIPLRQLFETPTVRALAAVVEDLSAAGHGTAHAPIEPVDRSRPLPLSFGQERLWFLHQLEPETTAYHNTHLLNFRGSLEVRALGQALEEIVRRHEVLRTAIALVDERPVQRISPPGPRPLPVVDLGSLREEDRQAQRDEVVRRESGRRFDLALGPLLRSMLLRLAGDDHVLVLCHHHLVFDGWSAGIFVRELAALYRAFAGGRPSPLEPLPIQYADYACWQRQWLQGEALERQLGWWRRQLEPLPPAAALAPDHPRREGVASVAALYRFGLPAATAEALRALSAERGATLFMTLMAAFQTLLHRHTGAEAVVVATPIANRHRYEIEGLIGFFANTQMIRGDFADDPSFGQLLDRMRERILGAYTHQDLPFERLVEALQPDRSASAPPLFQTMLALQNVPAAALELPGVRLRRLQIEGERRATILDLGVAMQEGGESLEGGVEYDATLFERTTIEMVVDHFLCLLAGVAADPDRPVGDLTLVSEPRRRQILEHRSRSVAARESATAEPEITELAALEQVRADFDERRKRLSAARKALLARRLDGWAQPAAPATTIPPRSTRSPVPLSFAQQRLWFFDQFAPGTPIYNIPSATLLTGAFDLALLARSLNEIVRRHQVLRTTIERIDGEPMQVIAPALRLPVALVDLSAVAPAAAREAEARRLAYWESQQGFDLSRGPLLRATVLRLDPRRHVILTTIHHIVADGWSMEIFTRELVTLWAAGARDPAARPALPALAIQYADFALWQRQWLAGETLDRLLGYWKKQLAGAPPRLELPWDRPRPAMQTFRGERRSLRLAAPLARALVRLGHEQQATSFMTLLAGFVALLARACAQSDVVVGTPIAGRNYKELEDLIGFVINTLVLRIDLSRHAGGPDPGFRRLVALVRQVAMDAFAHQDLPFERLVEELRPERDLSSHPLFQVTFSVESPAQEIRTTGDLSTSPFPTGVKTAKFDLAMELVETDGGIRGLVAYNADLFDDATMARWTGHFERLLAAAVEDPERPFSELPLLSAGERQQLLREWHAGALWPRWDLPAAATLGEWLAAGAARAPDAVAVRGNQMWSYAHLNALADRLARHLRALGVGPEIPVAMAAERVPEVVVGLLAILKAGGVCLPLDPSHPRERLAFLLRDAGARVLLARRAIADHLPSPEVHGARVVGLDDPWPDSGAGEGGGVPSPGWGEGPDNLAYLIYTSGTTGVPKAVAVSHRQVMPILAWSLRFFPLDERIRVLQTLSPCFDFGVFELLTTLLAGGTLCFLPVAEQADLTCAVEAIERHRVSCIHATPSFFRELVALGRRLPGLEIVHLGGEALSRALVRQIAAAVGPRCRLYNGYGPTETSINSAMYPLRGRPLERGLPGPVVPIGRITAGSTGYVLDRRGRSVAVGVPGELSIGGAGLARGYLNRPAATAERFVPDPRGDAGQRLYRSGDLVRRLADGNLEYLGRIDHQVKIRGFRIEPGEIEAVLSSHPAIAQAVVTARESAAGDRRLAAYLVARAPGERLEEPLRDWIRERLPDHMVPASFVFLDELPRTPGGKLDHRALPEPGPPAEGNAAPSNPTERILAEVWARVLGLDPPISVDANFFELGGHSLLATRVALAAEQALGVELPVSALFAGPTVRRLAAILHRQRTAGSPLVTIRAEGRRPPLFCVHPSGGNVLCFAPLAQALGEDQPLYGLEARGLRAGEKPRRRIGEMATAYLEAIRSFRSRGPYLLLGYSLGGLVAYEMAQQLLADAQEVPLVAIVDVPARRLADSGAFRISTAQILLELLDHELALSRRELESLDPEQQLTAVLEAARAAGALSPELGRRHAQRYLDLLDAGSAAVRRYSPQPYPGRVVLFTAAGEARRSADETLGWGELVPALKLCRTPGRHLTMLRSPHVELLAARLRDLLDTSRPV